MKIGIDARELRNDITTGIGRFLRQIIIYVCRERPKYKIILYGNEDTHFEAIGAKQENLESRKILTSHNIFFDQIYLPYFIKKDRLDIFFSPYEKCPIFAVCPVIITIHDMTEFSFEEYQKRLKNKVLKYMIKAYAWKASRIMTCSEYSRKDIIDILKVPPEKVVKNYNSIDNQLTGEPVVSLTEIKRMFGISGNYILYVGNFMPHKNLDNLIKAYSLLPDEIKDTYSLVLCGKKDIYAQRLLEKYIEYGLGNKIIFTDFVADSILKSLYLYAYLFVFPSLYEGFGYPILEAMSLGVPVIANDKTSLPEVVGQDGKLVDCSQPHILACNIKEVIMDTRLREQMKMNGLKMAKEFTIQKHAETFLNLIETLA